jgi:hypothetical protein
MTTRGAAASGNLTTAGTWGAIDATSASNSEANSTSLTTSFVESSGATTGIITTDGFYLKLASRAASPSGTMTVHLAIAGVEVVGSAVTVNVSDLPTCTATSGSTTPVQTAEGGWFFFKFAAPLTLLGATSYTVGAKTSVGSQVNLWRDGTAGNWSRMIRTTTTGAPAAGDDMIIGGEWTAAGTMTARTVTMDSTANTDYGNNTTTQVTPSLAICKGGTLTYGTTASTNYILRQSGHPIVYNGGTLNIGGTGAEIPRNSTAQLQIDCTLDGDFGIIARRGATVNTAGLSRTAAKIVSQCKLNADAAASAVSITLDTDCGWLSGDVVCLAPTTQTSTQFESKALTGNATATTAAIAALTNAHSGTAPTQAEVGLLTRNVVITGVTANVVTFFYIADTAMVNCSWTEFAYIGTNSAGKRGCEVNTTTGSCSFDYCSFHDGDASAQYWTGAAFTGVSLTNSVIFNMNIVSNAVGMLSIGSATSGTWTIDHNMFCGATGGSTSGINILDVGGICTNNSVSGVNGTALKMDESASLGTFTGNQLHSNVAGSSLGNTTTIGTSIFSADMWRNSSTGFTQVTTSPILGLTFQNCNVFGNGTAGFSFNLTAPIDITFDNVTINGDTTFSCTNSISLGSSVSSAKVTMYSCNLSSVTGIKTKCTNDFNFGNTAMNATVLADNCIANGTNLFAGVTGIPAGTQFLKFQNFGQTANDNRSYVANKTSTPGLVQSDSSTVYSTNPLSEKMTPGSASVKLASASIKIDVKSGKTITPTVQVQKNSGYNGNAPRLILKRQDSMGITADTVLQTFSASANAWQGLTGTTASAPQDGVFEFVVDCDGTAGAAFRGDVTAVAA